MIGSALRSTCSSAFPWSGACVMTALDVLLMLFLQGSGFRFIEALVLAR